MGMDVHALRELDAAMLRLADGDRAASAPVFAALWPELVAFAERVLGRGGDADDAAQQALEKVFAQVADYDPQRSALAWGLAILSWECRTALQRRRRQRGREQPLDPALPGGELDPESLTVERSLRASLREAVAELSPADQRTLEDAFMRDAEGPREPAFRKRKERALTRLRAAWSKIHGD